MEPKKVNLPEDEELLAQHIAEHMKVPLTEARRLVKRHGNNIAKIEEERQAAT